MGGWLCENDGAVTPGLLLEKEIARAGELYFKRIERV